MYFKNKFFIIGLILLTLLTVSVVSAGENVTDVSSSDDNVILSVNSTDEIVTSDKVSDEVGTVDASAEAVGDSQNYTAKIIAGDVAFSYLDYGNEIYFQVEDMQGNYLDYQIIQVKWSTGAVGTAFCDGGGNYYSDTLLTPGNYKATIYFEKNQDYSAKPVTINVKILKSPVRLVANKWISTTKNYALLKVYVSDWWGSRVYDGTVRFIVNGKYYDVRVVNGLAVKKVLINRAGIHTYKAIFSSKNYKTAVALSHVFVKQAKSYYVLKFGNFAAKMTYKQYVYILNAKNTGKSAFITMNTGKYFTYKKPKYKTVKVTRTKWAFIKVLSYESFYYGDGSIDSYSYSLDKYYRAGWSLYGWYDKHYSDGYESYAKLKKRVKYTDHVTVRDGYTFHKVPWRMVLHTVAKDGQYPKGDYLEVYAGEPGRARLINLYTFNP